jgi:glycosyltransferase involved in cell wall biosynthesis
MRVAVDFRVVSTEAALRGMGRYTQQQVFEALRADPDLEVFLIVPNRIDPRRCLHDWLAMPRVHPIWLDGAAEGTTPETLLDYEGILQYSHRLQATLQDIGTDVFHNATPFVEYGPNYSALTRVPVVATCYDMIPMIFPKDYFESNVGRDSYYRLLRNVRTASRVAAISRSAATDLHLYTGYPADRIDIAYPFVDASFRPGRVDDERRAAARGALRGVRPDLPKRFMLSVTGIHRSKNAGFLIDSFAAAQRCRGWPGLPLVVVLPAAWTVDVFHKKFGQPEDTIILADVPEEVLRDLYLVAEFVFYPSLYEGFGYPVAEAMHCGAAVVAVKSSSIPEIAGDAAWLIGPNDREAGAAAIMRLATDQHERNRLRAAASSQAAAFGDPTRLGAATLACWRAAAATGGAPARTRIALWSSMPPLDCGIADYTAELGDALAATHEVDVYTDGSYTPSPRAAPNIHFRHVSDFDSAEPGLIDSIFQLQAREYQAFLYPEIIAHGGTIMLHDISLGAGFYVLARQLRRYSEFERHMLAVEGQEAVRDLGAALARSGGVLGEQALKDVFGRHRLLRWAVGGGNRVLTHTDALARELLRHYPEARVRVVRQGYGDRLPLARHLPLALWRQRLGVGAAALVVGVFGIVGRNKRIEHAISAFERLWKKYPSSVLVIVGRTYDFAYGEALKKQIDASPASARIVISDYAPPDVFHALMALCDVLVNLRWPPLGGLSAVLLRGLVAGKPVIVSDIPDWRDAGGEACLRVAPDDAEVETIAGHLLRLAEDPGERARLGRVARAWFLKEATLDVMVADHLTGGRPPTVVQKEGHL